MKKSRDTHSWVGYLEKAADVGKDKEKLENWIFPFGA